MQPNPAPAETTAALRRLVASVERVIAGNTPAVEAAAICLFAQGNLLLDGVPGVGKTMLARALALSVGGTFRRIQATPDLLPSDVTGISVYDQGRQEFRFVPGPVFANVVLVDEINRTTPRTQSSLLEPMEERQVTVEGVTYALPAPFMLVATKNPLEYHGTYPLPEGQLDRFAMTVHLGHPDRREAQAIVMRQMLRHPIEDVTPVLSAAEVATHQEAVRAVHVDPLVVDYAVGLADATRAHEDVALGASQRAVLALTRCAQAYAVSRGRGFVLPDDVKALAPAVLSHRLVLKSHRRVGVDAGSEIVREILAGAAVPLGLAASA